MLINVGGTYLMPEGSHHKNFRLRLKTIGFSKEQHQQLSEMELMHLENLRGLDNGAPFDELTKTGHVQPYLKTLRELNNLCKAPGYDLDVFSRLETEFVDEVTRFIGVMHDGTRKGEQRYSILIWVMQNLFYLIERAENYIPSDEAFEALVNLLPEDLDSTQ